MYHSVDELSKFYDHTLLGRLTRRRIQAGICTLWDQFQGDCLVGFGYTTPFITSVQEHFSNKVNLMPTELGVIPWPSAKKNISVLVLEDSWPLRTNTADGIIVAHALENTKNLSGLLDEIWRVLVPDGRALFILPHRYSSWSIAKSSPFSLGRPYSVHEATWLLERHRFRITGKKGVLFAPPIASKAARKATNFLEHSFGKNGHTLLSGALLIEARKETGITPPLLRIRDHTYRHKELEPAGMKQKTRSE